MEQRRQRVLWAAAAAVGVTALVGSGTLWLQQGLQLAATDSVADAEANLEQLTLAAQDAVQDTSEETCAVLKCSTAETEDGLTFTVQR